MRVSVAGGKGLTRRFSFLHTVGAIFDFVDVTLTDRRGMDLIDGFELQVTSKPRRRLKLDEHRDTLIGDVGFKLKATMEVCPSLPPSNANDAASFASG